MSFCLDDGSMLLLVAPDSYSTTPSHRDEPTSPQPWKPDTSSAQTLWSPPPRPSTGDQTYVYGGPTGAQGQYGAAPSSGGNNIWLIVGAAVIVVLLLLGAGLVAAFMLMGSKNKETSLTKPEDTKSSGRSSPTPTPRATPTATPTPTPTPQLEIGGTWTGSFDNSSSTMEINSNGDNTFTGTITGSDFQIAIAGKVDPSTRKIDFKETKVLRYKGSWKLGTNWGTVSADGRKMNGDGKSVGTYKWSFSKK